MLDYAKFQNCTTVMITVLSFPERNVIEGPTESNFFFEKGNLITPKLKKQYNKELLDTALQNENGLEILWRYGIQPVVISMEFR